MAGCKISKKRMFVRIISFIMAQVFFVTSLGYAEPVYHKPAKNLRIPMGFGKEKPGAETASRIKALMALQAQRPVFVDGANNVILQLKDGRAITLGNIQRPNFIFNKKIIRWAYVQKILDLTVDRWRVSPNQAKNFYEYVRETNEYVRKDIDVRSRSIVAGMYRGNKPYVTGMKEVEASIERWCERNAVALPGGWAENKNKKKEQRVAYLVAQVKSWFATALQEDDPRLEYRLFNAQTDITGLPFWSLPIFPVNERGEVDAGLVSWMINETKPPEGYFTAKKVSLEDLAISAFIASANPAEKEELARTLKVFAEARLSSFRGYFKLVSSASGDIGEIDHVTIAVRNGIHDIAKRFGIEAQEESSRGAFVVRTPYGIEIIQPVKGNSRSGELESFLEKRGNSPAVYYVALKTQEIEKTLASVNQSMPLVLVTDKAPKTSSSGDKTAFIHPLATRSRMLVELIEHKSSAVSSAHFSLCSKHNSLAKEGVADRFQIRGVTYAVDDPKIAGINKLGESMTIALQNGRNITFTIRGPTMSRQLRQYLTRALPEALSRSSFPYKTDPNNNITIILADKYDFLAGDHRQNNIIILNASDLEKMISSGRNPAFISELITSVLSEELAHERGADSSVATEQVLAESCAGSSVFLLGAEQIKQYIEFIREYEQDLETQKGYLSYLTEGGAAALKASGTGNERKLKDKILADTRVISDRLNARALSNPSNASLRLVESVSGIRGILGWIPGFPKMRKSLPWLTGTITRFI